MLSFFIQLIHLIIVSIVALTVMISTNKYTLIALFIGVAIMFVQALTLNGCVLTKIEGNLPFTDYKPNDLVRAFFGLKKDDISLESLEKILIGFTLMFLGFKIGFLLMFEHIYKNTYYQQVCIFLSSRKSWFERLLADFMN